MTEDLCPKTISKVGSPLLNRPVKELPGVGIHLKLCMVLVISVFL